MYGVTAYDLFTLVEKHPFRNRKMVLKGTEVSIRAKMGGYDIKILEGDLSGYTFELTEREYWHYIRRTD